MKFVIRDANHKDLIDIAKVKIDTWRSTYRGLIPDDILDHFEVNDQAEQFGEILKSPQNFLIVAEWEGTIAGLAAGGPEREGKYGIDGEVYAIYVLKEYQNTGAGKELMAQSAKKLVNMGFQSMLVWVLEKNPYRRFYEKIGGREIGKKTFGIGGENQKFAAYAWEPDIKKLNFKSSNWDMRDKRSVSRE
ncbi:MAG: GNAT family N-acetyltransferase [Clostridia bacterium]|nr:GNAT family N-acetyltransferase [Clostridia bacterium]